MKIEVGDYCILDPTNKIYKQNRNGYVYMICVSIRGLFRKKYVCCPIMHGAIIYDEKLIFRKKALVKIRDISNIHVVVRSDPNEPDINYNDVKCLDMIVALMDKLEALCSRVIQNESELLETIQNISFVKSYYNNFLKDKLQYFADRNVEDYETPNNTRQV